MSPVRKSTTNPTSMPTVWSSARATSCHSAFRRRVRTCVGGGMLDLTRASSVSISAKPPRRKTFRRPQCTVSNNNSPRASSVRSRRAISVHGTTSRIVPLSLMSPAAEICSLWLRAVQLPNRTAIVRETPIARRVAPASTAVSARLPPLKVKLTTNSTRTQNGSSTKTIHFVDRCQPEMCRNSRVDASDVDFTSGASGAIERGP